MVTEPVNAGSVIDPTATLSILPILSLRVTVTLINLPSSAETNEYVDEFVPMLTGFVSVAEFNRFH